MHEVFDEKRKDLFSLPIELVREEISHQLIVAGEHVPVLKSLLRYKGKKHAYLSSENLIEFLTNSRHICSLLGIKVILPKSLVQAVRPRIALAAKPKSEKEKIVSYLNLNDMLEFSWQVSIGDKNISAEEFCILTESASGIVKFNDQYLLVDPDSLNSILKALKDPPPRLSAMETLRAAVTGEVSDFVFDPGIMLRQMIDALSAAKDVPLPVELCAQLRPYQQRCFVWLYNNTARGLGSCLADDMGLGKTIQVLTLLLKLKEEKWSKKPALVICPTTLIGNWQKECQKFAPTLNAAFYHGTSRELNEQADLLITSYGMLRRDVALFKKVKWGVVIIDEAQNIKNTDTDQTKAIKSLSAKCHIALSGTPVENRLMELWSIFDFINRGYLGKQKQFAANFAYPIEKYKDEEKIAKLVNTTAPFMLRRLKSDKSIIKDLPPKIIKDEHCLLSREQAALYQQTVQNLMRKIEENEGIARKGFIFKLMTSYQIGQNSTVTVNRLISLGTFEEKINEMMSAKRELAALTVAAGESGLSELFNQDLKELFDLDTTSYLSGD